MGLGKESKDSTAQMTDLSFFSTKRQGFGLEKKTWEFNVPIKR